MYKFFLFALLLVSCHKYSATDQNQYLFFEGLNNKEALLSKVNIDQNGKKNIIPLKRVFTNTKILLPAGKYLLSNECSSYEFIQTKNTPKIIFLSHLQLNLLGNTQTQDEINNENEVIQTLCYNELNQKEYAYKNKTQFDILPGINNLFISGKNLSFNIQPGSFENLSYDLSPLTLVSATHMESENFYATSQTDLYAQKKIVISAPINGKMWLFPGQYTVEINGTKEIVDLKLNHEYRFNLGLLKIVAPKNFLFQTRIQRGGQPISAFIDGKVLIRLNTDYPVFAGKYILNLEGSGLEKEIEISENKLTEVKTFGAEIDEPVCTSKITSCFGLSRITIHENKQPFILMIVPVGLPFLVFEGHNYQYGVEGMKGIFKTLPVSSDSVKTETLGRVNVKWEVRYTNSNNSTDFVRFESKSPNLFGKSVDLSFFKPTEVYLPEGEYWLTYYVGDGMNQILPKIRTDVNLNNGVTKDITIPIFVHANKDLQKESNYRYSSSGPTSTLVPIKK